MRAPDEDRIPDADIALAMRRRQRVLEDPGSCLVEVDIEAWIEGDPELRVLVEEARVTGQIARLVYDERHAAELTRRQLADLARTSQSVITRLEDDNYEGHSLALLRRVAAALGKDLEVCFEPRPQKKGRAGSSVPIPGAFFGDPSLYARIDDEVGNLRVAQLICGARTRAKLTHRRLADLVGTTQAVIARLENGAHRGHSLGMLHRIAAALGCDLELHFARRWR